LSGIATFQTGFPIDHTNGQQLFPGRSPTPNSSSWRRSRHSREDTGPPCAWANGNAYINRNAYLIAPAYTFGNLARNVAGIRTRSQTNLNASLGKTTRITEAIKLTLRIEANKATNTPKFGGPNSNLSSTTFGTITSQVGFSRQLQWMARIHW
ncbi:MAG TPA: hypothetical protein VFU37_07275, partial [Pyrinomonadaceae bacterium]|nr:hypothetical protein [Pyrinomonadaceae bacterium]